MASEPVTVNGESIPEEDILSEVERLKAAYQQQFGGTADAVQADRLRELCLDNLVARALLRQAADSIDVDEDELEKAFRDVRKGAPSEISDDVLREDLRRDLKVRKLVAQVQGKVSEPGDEDIEEYYRSRQKEFETPAQVHARHLVKHLDKGQDRTTTYLAMLNVREELKRGASFAEMVEKHSDCPDRGGDLGFFSRGQMVQEFDGVVFEMKEGEISDVFETPFGYHIAMVEAVKPATVKPLSEAREAIFNRLYEEKKHRAVQDYVEELKSEAEISPRIPSPA